MRYKWWVHHMPILFVWGKKLLDMQISNWRNKMELIWIESDVRFVNLLEHVKNVKDGIKDYLGIEKQIRKGQESYSIPQF